MADLRTFNSNVLVRGTLRVIGSFVSAGTTFNNPAFSGTATGTYTLGGTPTVTAPTITTPTITGAIQEGAAAGAAGAVTQLIVNKVLANNSFVDFATVTVPNVIGGCGIRIDVQSTLGDGDSTQMSIWNIAVARIPGANGAATTSSVGVSATKNGATGNAVVTVQASAFSGGVGASQTFTVQIKNARSAGAADNHPTTAVITLLNAAAGGSSIVAA